MSSKMGIYANMKRGNGLPIWVFVQYCGVGAIVLALCKNHPSFSFVYEEIIVRPNIWTFIVMFTAIGWVFPFKEISYVLDRVDAIRAQLCNIVPYAHYLLPQLTQPEMIAASQTVIDNIEKVGPMIPIMMQDGVRQHLLPVMPQLMGDLELLLTKADLMDKVMIKIAPHVNDLLPYMKDLLPYMEDLLPIMEVDGWYKVNPYLPVLVKHLDVIAPYSAKLAPHMPAMFPYLDVLARHIDDMDLEETLPIIDQVTPLLPLLPICEAAGLLEHNFTFKSLPMLVKTIPVGPETTGRAAAGVASWSDYMASQARGLGRVVSQRYLASNAKAPLQIEDQALQKKLD